jgi:predicted kinase
MKKEIIILVGISGSGKTTFASNFMKENLNYLRVNRDDIRKTLVGNLNGYYQRKDLNELEQLVTELEESMSDVLLCNDNIIIDNTNLKQRYINKWIKYSQDTDIYHNLKFKLFDISLEESQRRVCKRESLHNFEDLNYIEKQYNDYQEIKKWLISNYKDKII